MTDQDETIDWNLTTWEGSRREQLRRWRRLSIPERFAALEQMTEIAEMFQEARGDGRLKTPGFKTSSEAGGIGKNTREYKVADDYHAVALGGCTPAPLASYLKALGILRLVAEQVDPDVRGCWQDERFVLIGRLDAAELQRFFLENYRPTALVAPWGARSGFYPGSSEKTAREALQAILETAEDRLAPFREAIGVVRALLHSAGLEEKVDSDQEKLALLRLCRAELPDHVLQWLDACYVLTGEGRRFPPLLGTGGNEGSGSYVSGFAQQVVRCIVQRKHDPALCTALFGKPVPMSASDQAPGQFAPNAAGGPNLGTGFSAPGMMNPWEYLLCLEGTLLFASAATRRLESMASASASFPFTVETTGSGSGAASLGDEKEARAEMWVPLWDAPIHLEELRGILNEGRVQVARRQAKDGLDFIRAVSRLGVDRGIAAFQRYGFVQRFGRNVIAATLNRVPVRRNQAADLTDDLDSNGWLRAFRELGRGANGTQRIHSLVRRLEDTLFNLALDRHDPGPRVQRVLILLGEVQLYFALNPKARKQCHPVPRLSPEWLVRAEDGSPELALAAALAGLHGRCRKADGGSETVLPMRAHLAPEHPGRQPHWLDQKRDLVTWGPGRLQDNLLATLRRRLLEAERQNLEDKPLFPARAAPMAAVAAWLAGAVDERRMSELLPGLALIDIPRGADSRGERLHPLPSAYRLLKPFFCTDAQLHRAGLLEADRKLPIPADLLRRLAAGDVDGALEIGRRRLRVAGLEMTFSDLTGGRGDGRNLLAALMVPVTDFELRRLLPKATRPEADTTH